MKKMAIISTYNENCGNASYTHVLKTEFSKYVEVDVFALDLFTLQSRVKNLIAAGDRHIQNMCAELKKYDYVNIQFEAGLYGVRIKDMLRRIQWLIDAAPNLTLTMHRVDTDKISATDAAIEALKQGSIGAYKRALNRAAFANLSDKVIQYCKTRAKEKNVWIKVHTKRERRSVQEIFQSPNAYDYPLVFLTQEERSQGAIRITPSDRDEFLRMHGFSPDDKVIGLFGYLSNYKGIETAIEALTHLPENYKLGLFGSQHPQSVKKNQALNPYLESLFDLITDLDDRNYKRALKIAKVDRLSKSGVNANGEINPANIIRTKLSDRVKFIGSLPDQEFIQALKLCDAVVLPYLEVGQSMSGVAVLGMEAGAKMLCANNNSFKETKRYYQDCFASFDMGNALELAQKISHCSQNPELYEFRQEREKAFAEFSLENSIKLQLEKFGFKY